MTSTTVDPTTKPAKHSGAADPKMFEDLRSDLQPWFINRDAELDLVVLALVAKSHLFLLSSPGTAKSMLITEVTKRISGAHAFLCMFDRFADDSLVFGPQSLQGLREGRRRRETDGYLPDAQLFFADEIWKASSALVNTLLQALNERIMFDDGVQKEIPLHTMFCASNELPQQDHGELQAIYDRVGLRRVVPALTDPSDMLALLDLPAPPEHPDPVLDWSVVLDAHVQAMAMPIADGVQSSFIDIVTRCHTSGVPIPSGRRQREAMRLVRAVAWLAGASEATEEHLEFLTDFLWENPDQRPDVSRVVLGVVSPLGAEAAELSDDVAGLITLLQEILALDPDSDERTLGAAELSKKVNRAAHKAADLEGKATGRARAEVDKTIGHIYTVHRRMMGELYDLDEQHTPDVMKQARNGDFART